MRLLWFSTGLCSHRYGQQRYEGALFEQWYRCLPEGSRVCVFLLGDVSAEGLAARFPNASFRCFGRSRGIWGKARFFLAACKAALTVRPHLAVCGHMHLFPVCLFLRQVFGVPYSLLSYGIEVWEKDSALRRYFLRRALFCVSMSTYTASFLQRMAGVPWRARLFVVPGFVDGERFSPGPKPAELAHRLGVAGRKVILTVARVSPEERKGYRTVIEAMPEVLAQVPDVSYLIVGGGADLEGIRGLAGAKGVGDAVVAAGFVRHEDLAGYYNLCDVFVMPSAQEGFGLVFVEALACGKAVIAGSGDGSREALLGGRAGILVDPGSAAKVASAIIGVLQGTTRPELDTPQLRRDETLRQFGREMFDRRVAEVSAYAQAKAGEKG